MKCTKCEKDDLGLRDGQFLRAGTILDSIPAHNFLCNNCVKAIDTTSREPDDKPIPVADW